MRASSPPPTHGRAWRAMAALPFVGTWKVIECCSHTGITELTGIEGTLFCLDESGDVVWTMPDGTESLPLFNCETYEIYHISLSKVVIRFGAYAGHVIEFRVDQAEPVDSMTLTCEGWYHLQCKRIVKNEPDNPDSPFSLLPALEDGYFSDLTITAMNNKQFAVHICILKMSAPSLDWMRQPPPLSGLTEEVLGTILHYLYAECLPTNLSELTARQCITAAQNIPGLEGLIKMCKIYLNNMALKQQIIGLISDMHASASQIIDYYTSKVSSDHSGDSLNSNPAKLCFVVKQSVRETAVVGVKLLILCDLFTKRKSELLREERHEIIRYAKSRLPDFMLQLQRFLQGVKQTFSSMSPSQRQEVATYLVPEIEVILETVSALIHEVRGALEHMIHNISPNETHKPNVSEVLVKSLRTVLHVREISKLKMFHQRMTSVLEYLIQKKEHFNSMSSGNKVRSVARNLEQLIEELPIFLLRLEEVTAALDEMLEWREFKFCFKVGTSKVSGVLQKLLSHSDQLQDVLVQLCDLVQRDAFTQSLLTLGLLDPSHCSETSSSAPGTTSTNSTVNSSTPKHSSSQVKLNLVQSLCMSPMSRNSLLSRAALALLRSGQSTDMLFEIIPPQEGIGECSSDATSGSATNSPPTPPVSPADSSNAANPGGGSSEPNPAPSSSTSSGNNYLAPVSPTISSPSSSLPSTTTATSMSSTTTSSTATTSAACTIRAHRVIVAGRCDLFRRALLSGMREAIDRKIVIRDTTPTLFRALLEYLYGGQLCVSSLGVEQLADLMLLADRYEVDTLKQACEHALLPHIDDESVLYFLSMADQVHAKTLRGECLLFISMNPDIMNSELFEELPQNLQAEIYDQVIWVKPRKSATTEKLLPFHCASPETPTSVTSSVADPEEMSPHLNLHENSGGFGGDGTLVNHSGDLIPNAVGGGAGVRVPGELSEENSSSLDESVTQDSARLEACLTQLRAVVGEHVSRDRLVLHVLAADYDVNRALNFFYSS